MRRWREVQKVYEMLDFMGRGLGEAEERYELVLTIGFLQRRDPTGTDVACHVLLAPAEITFDAARGMLAVAPAAWSSGFRVELDMLELQDRPETEFPHPQGRGRMSRVPCRGVTALA